MHCQAITAVRLPVSANPQLTTTAPSAAAKKVARKEPSPLTTVPNNQPAAQNGKIVIKNAP